MSKKEIIHIDLWASDSKSVKHAKSGKSVKRAKGGRKKTVARPPSRPPRRP